MRHARQVVHHVHHALERLGLAAARRLVALFDGAPPVVLEIGGRPQGPVLPLGELALQPLDRLVGRLGQLAAQGVLPRGPGGILGLQPAELLLDDGGIRLRPGARVLRAPFGGLLNRLFLQGHRAVQGAQVRSEA